MRIWLPIGFLCFWYSGYSLANSEVTEVRQQLFTDIEEQSEQLEDRVDDQQWLQAASLAEKIADDVAKLQSLFPTSSKGEGRSRDKVWGQWPTFSKKLYRFENQFRDVANAIQSEQYERAEDRLDDATSSCRSCHMSYRSLW